MQMKPRVFALGELEVDRPMPGITRRRLIGANAMISEVTLDKGFTLASHQHENEQFVVVLLGRARFGLGRKGEADYEEVVVEAGQVLHLPANAPHSCEALCETHILDIFSPPSRTTGIDGGKAIGA